MMPSKTLDDIAGSFALFDNWEDRYRYLLDLGQRIMPIDDSLKTDEHLVHGCTSRVWLIVKPEEKNGTTTYHFMADSDAKLVKGLIYLLMVAYQDKTEDEIDAVNIDAAFEKIGLHQHLSPNRRNGFYAMVHRIKALAAT